MYSRFPLYAARSILMGVDIENTMFCSTERKYYFMYLSGKSREVELTHSGAALWGSEDTVCRDFTAGSVKIISKENSSL